MSRNPLRRTASAAVLTLALGAFAACGGGGDEEASDEPTAAESSATSDESTGEPSEPAESEGAEPTAGEEIDASELVDVFAGAFEKATTATFEMSIEGASGFAASGQSDFSQTPPDMQLSLEVAQVPEPIEMIIVDGTLYQSNPGTGGKFTATPLDDPSSPFGGLAKQLDIRAQLGTFEEAVTAATYVGEEDGLDHYSVVVDSQTLLEEQGTDLSAVPQGSLPPEFTYDLFFDDEGYFRRMETSLGDLGGDVTASYDNWGEPVDISAPPASEIQ